MDLKTLIDLGKVISVAEPVARSGGGRSIAVRCMMPVTLAAFACTMVPDENREADDDAPEDREMEAVPTSGIVRIRGIASSTGKDWYGTEMTRDALLSMKAQMEAGSGLVYLPTHGEYEWSDVIGHVREAIVEEGDVPTAYDPDERQFILRAATDLKMNKARAQELLQAIRDGDEIGQSIGAWFTSLTYVENDKGELERILVNDLRMDHLAGTRGPANSESMGLEELRDKLVAAVRSRYPVTRGTPPVDAALDAVAARDGEPAPDTDAAPEVEAQGADPVASEEAPETGAAPDAASADAVPADPVGDAPAAEADPETLADPVVADAPEVTEEPEAATAEASTPVHPDGGNTDVEEIDMTKEELAAIVAAVETALAARAAPAGAPAPPEPTVEEIRAENARLRAEAAVQERRIARLVDNPAAEGRAKMYEDPVVREAVSALDGGDMSPLVELTKSQGKFPQLVRVIEGNPAVRKVLTCVDDPTAPQVSLSQIKDAARLLFRAFAANGGFTQNNARRA